MHARMRTRAAGILSAPRGSGARRHRRPRLSHCAGSSRACFACLFVCLLVSLFVRLFQVRQLWHAALHTVRVHLRALKRGSDHAVAAAERVRGRTYERLFTVL